MLLKALMMIRFEKKLIKPGESFEAPQSQAILMIQNKFAMEDKSGKGKTKKEETAKTGTAKTTAKGKDKE